MEEHKLHKVSPLFILWDNIKKLIFPALIAVLGSRSSSWELYALGGAAVVSLISIVQYRFYRYWLEDSQIRVKEGIIFRNLRQVKYDKIQNLNLIQGPLHRLFGVAKVQLESASGGKPEAIINVVDLAAVKEIQNRIHQEVAEENAEKTESTQSSDSILSLNFAEIVRYGIISNKGLIAVALFFGFASQFIDDDKPGNFKPLIEQGVTYVSDGVQSIAPDTSVISTIVVSFLLFILAMAFLWTLSIGMAWFKFHGFNLQEKKDKLLATMGLLTRLQATIPLSRIQTITVHNSLLHRMFDRIGVTIETAGGVNTDQQGITMKHVAPLLIADRREEFLSEIQRQQDWSEVQWILIEPRAWRRMFKISLLIWSAVLLILTVYSVWLYAINLGLAAVWSVIYAKWYVKNAGYYLSEDMVAFKSGVIFRKETYVPLPKVQTARIKESLFDRRHKMAGVELDTAGAAIGAHHIDIPYLNYQDAERVYQFISSRIKNIEFEW